MLYNKMFFDRYGEQCKIKFNTALAEKYLSMNVLRLVVAYYENTVIGFKAIITDAINARA